MPEKLRNRGLLVLFLICIGIAVCTILPSSGVAVNDLGYVSNCPFAPWSTLAMLLLAGVVWVLRQYLSTRPPVK